MELMIPLDPHESGRCMNRFTGISKRKSAMGI